MPVDILPEPPVCLDDLVLDILQPNHLSKNPWLLESLSVGLLVFPLPAICFCWTHSRRVTGGGACFRNAMDFWPLTSLWIKVITKNHFLLFRLESTRCQTFRQVIGITSSLPSHHLSTMLGAILRRNMSQKLSVLLLVFGLAWGLMLLRYTVQQPRHQSSAELREQILELSRRYVKVLTEENQNAPGGPQGTSMAGYGKHFRRIYTFSSHVRSTVF